MIHPFFKAEQLCSLHRFLQLRVVVAGTVKFHGVKATAVDIEMQVPLIKIGRHRLPYHRIRVALLQGAPDLLTNAPALHIALDVEEVQVIALRLK